MVAVESPNLHKSMPRLHSGITYAAVGPPTPSELGDRAILLWGRSSPEPGSLLMSDKRRNSHKNIAGALTGISPYIPFSLKT